MRHFACSTGARPSRRRRRGSTRSRGNRRKISRSRQGVSVHWLDVENKVVKMTMANVANIKRDYSLVGESTRRALEVGLASAEWYHSEVPRATMKELMKRTDGPAIRDTILWIGGLLLPA